MARNRIKVDKRRREIRIGPRSHWSDFVMLLPVTLLVIGVAGGVYTSPIIWNFRTGRVPVALMTAVLLVFFLFIISLIFGVFWPIFGYELITRSDDNLTVRSQMFGVHIDRRLPAADIERIRIVERNMGKGMVNRRLVVEARGKQLRPLSHLSPDDARILFDEVRSLVGRAMTSP